MSKSYVLVAGASRGVGREIVSQLVNNRHPVKVILRSKDAQAELESVGASVVLADALSLDELKQALIVEGEKISSIISTIGGLSKDGQRSDFLGNKNLIDLGILIGVEHFILISSIGSGESSIALSSDVLKVLAPVLKEKEMAESYLIDSGLNYTIIRPGGLKSEPATGRGILTQNYKASGIIHRADVARLIYQCFLHPSAKGKIFSAVDQDLMYAPIDSQDFVDFKNI